VPPIHTCCILLAFSFQNATWKRQELDTGFSVEAPAKLAELVRNGDGVNAPKGLDYWMAKLGDELYVVSRMPRRSADAKVDLEAFVRSTVRPGNGKEISRVKAVSGRHTGLQVEYKNDAGMHSVIRVYSLKHKVVMASVTWPASNQRPKGLARYLKSLRLPKS
jgi:hypothetical protein